LQVEGSAIRGRPLESTQELITSVDVGAGTLADGVAGTRW
jgi:hypothetical protein